MQENLDQLILFFQGNTGAIVFYVFFVGTILSVALAFMGRVVFYANYSDLGQCAAMFALPALVLYIGFFYLGGLGEAVLIAAGLIFVALFVVVAARTWKSNRSLWKTLIVLIGKTTLSFLYVIHLFDALTAKNRSSRGASWFALAILTPLMVALVADRSGKSFSLPSGRGRF